MGSKDSDAFVIRGQHVCQKNCNIHIRYCLIFLFPALFMVDCEFQPGKCLYTTVGEHVENSLDSAEFAKRTAIYIYDIV